MTSTASRPSVRPHGHLLLAGPYVPRHDENRMHHEGDVVGARARFLSRRFRNLEVLLQQRYSWMNAHIKPTDTVVEFGCGAGFARLYVTAAPLILTDYVQHDWVDKQADAMNPPFEVNSIDVVICSHMVHHMASPVTFFAKLHPLLRKGGRVIIQDLNTALLLRLMLRAMRHEGWSYDIDVFDKDAVTNDPDDPWSANCAIPELMFDTSAEFEARVPGYTVIKNELNEALLFPLSGGVISKTRMPELPGAVLTAVQWLDRALVSLMPSVFALGRSVVLEKRG